MPRDPFTHDRAIPIFPGDDLDLAKDFYVRKLGFTVAWEHREDDRTGMMGLERGTIELMIDCPMTGHGRNVCASVRVHSADAYYDAWKDKVKLDRAPMNEPWGGRTFGCTDPFGNLLFIVGPVVEEG